ncbi:hypothetical protein BDV40DRAFT_279884 [Aspergillus tamarii]|uniref:Secreted protein n=1 Tax=Aspergillus tamarii TaxID=41984 RepID=A0A5N6UE73_ASPTM|nr:hypothetical protein BDV40DRAFT_279884 [Aspergillus tamarii]
MLLLVLLCSSEPTLSPAVDLEEYLLYILSTYCLSGNRCFAQAMSIKARPAPLMLAEISSVQSLSLFFPLPLPSRSYSIKE